MLKRGRVCWGEVGGRRGRRVRRGRGVDWGRYCEGGADAGYKDIQTKLLRWRNARGGYAAGQKTARLLPVLESTRLRRVDSGREAGYGEKERALLNERVENEEGYESDDFGGGLALAVWEGQDRAYTHERTHARTQARTHARARAHTHTLPLSYTHPITFPCRSALSPRTPPSCPILLSCPRFQNP